MVESSLLFFYFFNILCFLEYAAKDATVNFNDGKQLGEVFVVKSKNKNKG